MERFVSTGASVPAWVREQVGRYERAWPLWALGAAAAGAALVLCVIGGCVWNAATVVCYARP